MTMDYKLAFVWCQNFCDIWDPNESGKVLEQFVAKDPGDRWSRVALATCYYLTSQFDQTQATLATLADSDVDARALRVKVAIAKGEIDAARDLLRAGPADNAGLDLLRGQLALSTGDPRTAAEYFRAVLRKEPDTRLAIHGLGVSLRLLKNAEAEKWLQIGARHDNLLRTIVDSVTTLHTDPRLFSRLGALCEALNMHEEARVWFRLAIERDPLDADAQQGLTRLDADGNAKRAPDSAQGAMN